MLKKIKIKDDNIFVWFVGKILKGASRNSKLKNILIENIKLNFRNELKVFQRYRTNIQDITIQIKFWFKCFIMNHMKFLQNFFKFKLFLKN